MNVLVSRPDRVGDVVISTTLIPALRATAGVGRVCFLGREDLRGLVAPCVDAFVAVEAPDASDQLRALELAVSLHLHPHIGAANACARAGIPRRIGWSTDADLIGERLPYTKDRGDRHEAEFGFDLAASIGVKATFPLRPMIRSEVPAGFPSIDRPTLAVHVGASSGKAELPLGLLQAVARGWVEDGGGVEALGAAAEVHLGAALVAALPNGAGRNLCGTLSLPQMAGIAGRATVFLGRDSGPAHLAAAAGGNVVVIFPAARPDMGVIRWRPLGARVRVIEIPGRARWWEKTERASRRLFAGLDPGAVLAVVRAAVGGTS